MTPLQLASAAIKIYGRKKWQVKLAQAIGVNVSTVHRIMHRDQVPGPIEVALNGMLDHARRQRQLAIEARKLLPVRLRKHIKGVRTRKRRTIPKPRLKAAEPDCA